MMDFVGGGAHNSSGPLGKSIFWAVFVILVLQSSVIPVAESSSHHHHRNIEMVKDMLLDKFRLARPPRMGTVAGQFVPKAVKRLYQAQMNAEWHSTTLPLPGSNTASANTVHAYTHQESAIDSRFPDDSKFRLNFNFTDFPSEEFVTGAELRLTVEKANRTNVPSQRILVYDIVKPGIKNKTKPILRLVDSKIIPPNCSEVKVDVRSAIQRVTRFDDQSHHGLLVQVSNEDDTRPSTSLVRLKRNARDATLWRDEQPLLMIYSDDNRPRAQPAWMDPSRRKRRSPGEERKHNKRRERDPCRRRSLYVDFEKVGWSDWIVAPPGYDAYYCAGSCSGFIQDHLNTTNHAVVQNLVNSIHGWIPSACCVPTTLAAISLLYKDESGKIVLKNYHDMAVVGCGCR